MPSHPQPQTGLLNPGANFIGTSAAPRTTAYTANAFDVVVCDPSGGAFVVTLPAVTLGALVSVVNIGGTNAVTIKSADGSKINNVVGTTGVASGTTVGSALRAVSDGTNWYTI